MERGGAHSLSREGLGESQFRREDTVVLLYIRPFWSLSPKFISALTQIPEALPRTRGRYGSAKIYDSFLWATDCSRREEKPSVCIKIKFTAKRGIVVVSRILKNHLCSYEKKCRFTSQIIDVARMYQRRLNAVVWFGSRPLFSRQQVVLSFSLSCRLSWARICKSFKEPSARIYRPSFRENMPNARLAWLKTSVLDLFSRKLGTGIDSQPGGPVDNPSCRPGQGG